MMNLRNIRYFRLSYLILKISTSSWTVNNTFDIAMSDNFSITNRSELSNTPVSNIIDTVQLDQRAH